MDTIINKVAESGIITLDLAQFIPNENTIAVFDLKPFLFKEMILKEKDYREALKEFDWSIYTNKHVNIYCSADAIIPVWAYMLATSYITPLAISIFYGTQEQLLQYLTIGSINAIDTQEYKDKRIVLKGCGDVAIPEYAYVTATALLQPFVKSIMYGEPCSTVPVFKKKAAKE